MAGFTPPTINMTRVSDSAVYLVPADMEWAERAQSLDIEQEIEWSIGGSAYIFAGKRLGGIRFTLVTRTGVFVPKTVAEALKAEADTNPTEKYTLTLASGDAFTVCWNFVDGPAVDFQRLPITSDNTEATVVYSGTLRFFAEA